MKNLLQNLLILFSLGLCVLLGFQLHREGVLRDEFRAAEARANSANETIDKLRNDVLRLEGELARLDGLRKRLALSGAVSDEELARLATELQQHDQLATELESLKAALAKANENINTQNESLKELAEERNEIAERYNQLAEGYNVLAARWNEQQATATNRPSVTP
jgi:chromosome segregation ATPase